ncbi:MAG: hypothetical protein ACON4U_14875 [Myxococcota bacterium]
MLLWTTFFACETTEDAPSVGTPPTFYADAQPIIEQNCVRCHSEAGQGVGDFTDPDTVIALSEMIASAISDNRMPPPVSDPNCRDYLDSDMLYMDQESKDIVIDWVEQGALLGDPNTAQIYDRTKHTLPNADLFVTLPEAYTPTYTDENNPGNEYRCFAIPHGRTENFYITELHPIVDNPSMVHHIVLAKGTINGIIEGSTEPQGVDCIDDGTFIDSFSEGGMLSGWAPGMSPVRFPEGAGLLVRADEYIVMQMHYYQSPDNEQESDQSGYMFTTTDSVEHTIQMLPLGFQGFNIPAGDPAYVDGVEFNLPFGIKIWGVFPHMHVLGSGYSMTLPDEDEDDQCIVSSDGYDFNNQVSYIFDEPIEVEKDSPLRWACRWDNSSNNPYQMFEPPQNIGYGERTDEEMCYAFTLASF